MGKHASRHYHSVVTRTVVNPICLQKSDIDLLGYNHTASGGSCMRRSTRIVVSCSGIILALPAFFALPAGLMLMRAVEMLSGGQPSFPEFLYNSFSTPSNKYFALLVVALLLHAVFFVVLLSRFFARKPLPIFLELYCLSAVFAACGESIHLFLTGGDNFFWFGPFSVPHALFVIAMIAYENRPRKFKRISDQPTEESN